MYLNTNLKKNRSSVCNTKVIAFACLSKLILISVRILTKFC